MNQPSETHENIEFDDLNFLHVKPANSFNPDIVDRYDAVILEYSDDHNVLKAIRNIRSHNDKAVYITPVFLLNSGGNMDDTIVEQSDGVIVNLSNLDSAAADTRKIQSRM